LEPLKAAEYGQMAMHRYRHLAGAWFDMEDASQNATLAALEALRTYDPERPDAAPLGAYQWKAALNGAREEVLLWSSPVITRHRLENLRHLKRASLTLDPTTGKAPGEDAEEEVERDEVASLNLDHDPETLYGDKELAEQVRARVSALVGDSGRDFALAIFSGEWSAEEMADAHGMPTPHVSALRQRVRDILRRDRHLYALWQERMDAKDDDHADNE
jgi:DNA-directed RNA polymerase specialized sigma24 family protein